METKGQIDLFKFLAAILVVVIHTRPFAAFADVDYYVTCFCRIAVPFFFMASSFFFFSKEKPNIWRYTKRLLVLYFVWFLLESPIIYHRFFVAYEKPLLIQIINLFRCLLLSNTWLASWYIMASILSVNIVYWLSRKISNYYLLIIGVLGYIVSLICSSYNGAFDILLNERLRYYHAVFSFIFMPANSFIVAILYIVLGKIIAERVRENRPIHNKPRLIALLCLAGLLWGTEAYLIRWSVLYSDAFIFLPIFALIGFIILLQTDIKISSNVSRFLRSMSILVYILHPVLAFINTHVLNIDFGIILFIVTLCESLILAFVIVAMSSRVPILKKLY